MRIMSTSSRPILPGNFHVRIFHHVSVFFSMFDSAGRYLTTFLLKDNFLLLT